jgi:hypothetical protein
LANVRQAPSRAIESIQDLRRNRRNQFSSFDFIDDYFRLKRRPSADGLLAIRHLFSQSRNQGGQTLIIERLRPTGAVADENKEIRALFGSYRSGGLLRFSFWRRVVGRRELSTISSSQLLGYAILKRDIVPGKPARWHVFESVFRVASYPESYVPCARRFPVWIGTATHGRRHHVVGVLFCEQNGLNKSCAQVAVRSLAAHPESDRPYFSEINAAARTARRVNRKLKRRKFVPSEGFYPGDIQAALLAQGFDTHPIDYARSKRLRASVPYQKVLYNGLESGFGALLGFEFSGASADHQKHIIPIFGHTFNRSALVPHSESAYFRIGEHTRCVTSDAWLSSFIAHDDTFGSNYCLPRFYVRPEQVKFAAAITSTSYVYSGVTAEAWALDYLADLLNEPRVQVVARKSRWTARLISEAVKQKVVVRPVRMSTATYLQHLRDARDWNFQREYRENCDGIRRYLELREIDRLWIVELSVPELFPINQRKIGEIVLDASSSATKYRYQPFLLARVVDRYWALRGFDVGRGGKQVPRFQPIQSGLTNHVRVFRTHLRYLDGASDSEA